jgi:dUTP pyrophosphatase
VPGRSAIQVVASAHAVTTITSNPSVKGDMHASRMIWHNPTRMTTTVRIPIRRLPGSDDLPLPTYQTAHAAAMDVAAAVAAPLWLAPGAIALVPCGFALAVPEGHEAQLRPRSGLASKHGVTIINTPGTIDADYRGEVKVAVINLGAEPFTIERGMRIAQMLIVPVPRVTWEPVTDLPDTPRGAGGFGHTGHG